MPTTDTSRALDLRDTSSAGAGCGCGGCGCGPSTDTAGPADTTPEATTTTATKETNMATQTYSVTGMTCGHCASAVTSELTALHGVTDVEVDIVAGGASTVTVTSDEPLEDTQVAAALEEAGDYQLA